MAVFDDTDRIVYANAALHGCAVPDLWGRHLATFIDTPQQSARERSDDEAAGKYLVRVELILANEFRGRDVTANAIPPGPTGTTMFLDRKYDETIRRFAARRTGPV